MLLLLPGLRLCDPAGTSSMAALRRSCGDAACRHTEGHAPDHFAALRARGSSHDVSSSNCEFSCKVVRLLTDVRE